VQNDRPGPDKDGPRPEQTGAADPRSSEEELPFLVELWNEQGDRVLRVIARAMSRRLAQAIFASAQSEFPERRITLRRGNERLMDSQQK
jgi:hypothetical protein